VWGGVRGDVRIRFFVGGNFCERLVTLALYRTLVVGLFFLFHGMTAFFSELYSTRSRYP
jgi:hypothetical protein